MLRTKIIATYGPSIDDEKKLVEVLKYVDIVRLNFSHGVLAEKLAAIKKIRKVAKRLDKDIAIIGDLPGPKVRVAKLDADININKGDTVIFAKENRAAGSDIPIEIDIYKGMKVGAEISIGDGNPTLIVKRLRNGKIVCEALQDGRIGSRKGINVKGATVHAEPPTKEDLRFIRFARKNRLDFVALSFVSSAQDVRKTRKASGKLGIISKIERKEAIDDIENIARASDGVMIARGDMALSIDFQQVPIVQDDIINVCRKTHTPVIVATQMLDSMTRNQTPTRAEMTDISNAVRTRVDCLMLSDETSVGAYPLDAVQALSSIAAYTQGKISNPELEPREEIIGHDGMAVAAASISFSCAMDCIFIPTWTGNTAKTLSGLRPRSAIIVLSNVPELRRSMALHYGIKGVDMPAFRKEKQIDTFVAEKAKKLEVKSYMIVFGHAGRNGTSDTIRCFWGK